MQSLKGFGQAALVAAAALAAVVTSASVASADVVCSPSGDCWHVHRRLPYPGPGYVYHSDDWYFHRSWGPGPYHWRDYHRGRGYWRNGVWVPF